MSLNHYTADVIVTDAIMHEADSTKKSEFEVAVLANDEDDATSLIQALYASSGLACKTINGVLTIFRQAPSNLPGSIRSVKVENLTLVPEPSNVVIVPVPETVVDDAGRTVKVHLNAEGVFEGETTAPAAPKKTTSKKAAAKKAATEDKPTEGAAPTEESKPEESKSEETKPEETTGSEGTETSTENAPATEGATE